MAHLTARFDASCRGNWSGMGEERQRLLALLEVYDHAIEELYVLGDRDLLDFILRLERRRQEAGQRLARLQAESSERVSSWVSSEIESARARQPHGEQAY
jgi:hypothetical protein